MRFLYLRDPLFLLCVATYFVNRLVLKAIWKEGFVHDHLNDLICVPFWVPIVLFVQRRLGLRDGDQPPRVGEVVIPLLVWSWVFEIVLPQTALLGGRCVADYLDIVYYSLGALCAGVFWKWWYGGSFQPHSPFQKENTDVPLLPLGARCRHRLLLAGARASRRKERGNDQGMGDGGRSRRRLPGQGSRREGDHHRPQDVP